MCSSRSAGSFSSPGYSLVEVLVAMVILALTLTVLMRIFSAGLDSIGRASDYAGAVLVAESRLAAAGSGGLMVSGRTFGTDGEYRWTQSIEAYLPENEEIGSVGQVDAFVISVVVEWLGRSQLRSIELSTIRLSSKRRARG